MPKKNSHKWTDEELRKVVWRYKQNIKPRNIAADLNLNAKDISNIIYKLKKSGTYDTVLAELNSSDFSIREHEKISDAFENLTYVTEEKNCQASASEDVPHTTEKPPKSVIAAVQRALDNREFELEELRDKLAELTDKREYLKNLVNELAEWLEANRA